MTALSLVIIAATIVASSFLSGVFGIAGGMILLGVLLVYFDVATAMVMFSIIQLAANGWRVVLWWRFVIWRIFFLYLAGGIVAFGLMRLIAFVPDKATVYLLLGLLPYLVEALPAAARPNIEWRGVPFVTGLLTTAVHFVAGAGGLFLDIFFQKSALDRKTIVATKSATQTLGHVLRMLYFGTLAGAGEAVPHWTYGVAIVLAIGGTSLAPLVLDRMSDRGFRRWTRWLIFAVSAVYLVRGGWLTWAG